MRKLILLLALLLCPLSANAAYWYEFAEKSYIDLDSLKKVNGYGYAWVKLLNDGSMPNVNDKKIWFCQNTIYVDLKNKKTAYKDVFIYDLKGNKIESYTFDNLEWNIIIPDSVAENLYNLIDKYPQIKTFTNENSWVEIAENIQIDINSLMLTNSECTNMRLIMPANNIGNLKKKTKFVEAFMSVNLEKREVALVELKEYDKNKKYLNSKKYSDLNYVHIPETNAINTAINVILKMAKKLEQEGNNK